jgi:hypothetical protein
VSVNVLYLYEKEKERERETSSPKPCEFAFSGRVRTRSRGGRCHISLILIVVLDDCIVLEQRTVQYTVVPSSIKDTVQKSNDEWFHTTNKKIIGGITLAGKILICCNI